MAIGVLVMSLRPGYTSGDLSNFLFGSIVTVTRTDVQALAVLTLVVTVGTLLWLRPVMYVAFDRDFARSQGIPTRLISYVMSALIAVTIVLSIRIMGIVLLISLLTIPVTIVNTFTKSFRTLAPAAAAVAVAGNLAGLALSYNFEVSPGAAIIFTLTVTLILVKLLTLLVKKRRRADENHLYTRSQVLSGTHGADVLHHHVRADDECTVALHRRAGRQRTRSRYDHRTALLRHDQHDPDGSAARHAAGGHYDHG